MYMNFCVFIIYGANVWICFYFSLFFVIVLLVFCLRIIVLCHKDINMCFQLFCWTNMVFVGTHRFQYFILDRWNSIKCTVCILTFSKQGEVNPAGLYYKWELMIHVHEILFITFLLSGSDFGFYTFWRKLNITLGNIWVS